MSGRAIIFIVVGIIITSALVMYNIEAASTGIVQNFNLTYFDQQAQNLAQTGVNMAVRQLSNDITWRTGFPLMDLLGGKVVVTAVDSSFSGLPAVLVKSIGILNYNAKFETRDTAIAYVRKNKYGPITVKASIMTNANTKDGGGMQSDGRDHDTSDVFVGHGVLGMWTTGSFTIGGSSTIGGTNSSGKDIAPKGKVDTSCYAHNQTYPGGYPTTPDGFLGGAMNGFPEGTLKTFAQSGVSGSQYKTDPSTLTYPLSGVTYVELPSGSSWSPKLTGAGIIVVHNSSTNAVFKSPSGTFCGLIIMDDVTNLSGLDLIGAIAQLSPAPSSDLFGSSNGTVHYSSQALAIASNMLNGGGSNGSTANVIGWWE